MLIAIIVVCLIILIICYSTIRAGSMADKRIKEVTAQINECKDNDVEVNVNGQQD